MVNGNKISWISTDLKSWEANDFISTSIFVVLTHINIIPIILKLKYSKRLPTLFQIEIASTEIDFPATLI